MRELASTGHVWHQGMTFSISFDFPLRSFPRIHLRSTIINHSEASWADMNHAIGCSWLYLPHFTTINHESAFTIVVGYNHGDSPRASLAIVKDHPGASLTTTPALPSYWGARENQKKIGKQGDNIEPKPTNKRGIISRHHKETESYRLYSQVCVSLGYFTNNNNPFPIRNSPPGLQD